MNDPIVHSSDILALIGAADLGAQDLNIVQRYASIFVAVDGGANHLETGRIMPAAVIGDLDSLSDAARARFAQVLHPVTEQETTDLEKALTRVAAPLILAAGFLGGRIDHTFSALNVLARHARRAVILIGTQDICFLARPGPTRLTLDVGSRVSLLPLEPTQVTTRGLAWDVQDAQMKTTGFISVSNAAAAPDVVIEAQGRLLITLPVAALPAAIAAVRAE